MGRDRFSDGYVLSINNSLPAVEVLKKKEAAPAGSAFRKEPAVPRIDKGLDFRKANVWAGTLKGRTRDLKQS